MLSRTRTVHSSASLRREVPFRVSRHGALVRVPRSAATDTVAEPAPGSKVTFSREEVEALHQKLEAKAKAIIALEEEEYPKRPKVRFSLVNRVDLGGAWKIVGSSPELGHFLPEVAPYMSWSAGDVWTLEVPLRPGVHVFKAVKRSADGAYVWEEGPDREIEVPRGNGPEVVTELKLTVKLPGQ